MKTLMLLLFGFTLMINMNAQNTDALDVKYGFRGIRFTTPPDSLNNRVEVEKGIFISTKEDLTLGNYSLKKVVYHYYNNKLYMILIETTGYSNSRGVLNIFQQAYGKGYQQNEYIEAYIWTGRRVGMMYDENSITNDATIMMVSKPLMNLKEQEEKKANADAAKKL